MTIANLTEQSRFTKEQLIVHGQKRQQTIQSIIDDPRIDQEGRDYYRRCLALDEIAMASINSNSGIHNKMFVPAKGPKVPPMANKAFTVAVDLAIAEFIPIEMTYNIALTQYGIKPANYKQWVKGWNACRQAIMGGVK